MFREARRVETAYDRNVVAKLFHFRIDRERHTPVFVEGGGKAVGVGEPARTGGTVGDGINGILAEGIGDLGDTEAGEAPSITLEMSGHLRSASNGTCDVGDFEYALPMV